MTRALGLLTSFVLTFAAVAPAHAQGAIFTTNFKGDVVNGNVYKKASDVYLNADGLPDGNYYFQVTSPSGDVLLSSDPVANRVVTVSGGVITGTSGSHDISNGGPTSPKRVQLVPFDPTPSSGREYKVWMTHVDDYDGVTLGGSHGFIPKFSKSDNFKTKAPGKPMAQTTISGTKIYDLDLSGNRNGSEVLMSGWIIELWKDDGNGTRGIEDTLVYSVPTIGGQFEFIVDQDLSTYFVVEATPPEGFIAADETLSIDPVTGNIVGATSGATWLPTTPTEFEVVADQDNPPSVDFGNVKFETFDGQGLSKGFFHSENGREMLRLCELQDPELKAWRVALNALCLWYPSGQPFSVSLMADFDDAFDSFSDWIVGQGTEGVAAYILGTQVAAGVLNKTCGNWAGETLYIDLGEFTEDIGLVSFDFLLDSSTDLLCMTDEYGMPIGGMTGPHDTLYLWLRNLMLGCSGEWDTMNTNSGSTVYHVDEDGHEEDPFDN